MNFIETRFESGPASTLVWDRDDLTDWVTARVYRNDGETVLSRVGVGFDFDSATATPDQAGSILSKRLGTKGVILYEKKILRELNRSYYHASRYDYPVASGRLSDGRQILVHCPNEYNRLEIEDLITGEPLSRRESESLDFFHSRLEVSPNGKWLLSAGWFWHPLDCLEVFDLAQAAINPETLDKEPAFQIFNTEMEVQSAVFTPDSDILIVTSKEDDYEALSEDETFFGMNAGQIGLFSPEKESMLWTKDWTSIPGSLVVGGPWALCLYQYPKLYRWQDWTLVHEWPHLFSGTQVSSIQTRASDVPVMAFDLDNDRFAISDSSGVTIVEIVDSSS